MPIVIRELVIRAEVRDTPMDAGQNGGSSSAPAAWRDSEINKLVALCVEKTLKVLERKQEK